MSTWRCGWIFPRSDFFAAAFLAGAKVHLWRIEPMWRSSSTQRPGRYVVGLVVFIVVARGIFGLSARVASGPVLFHV
jgi:hypothetical protein